MNRKVAAVALWASSLLSFLVGLYGIALAVAWAGNRSGPPLQAHAGLAVGGFLLGVVLFRSGRRWWHEPVLLGPEDAAASGMGRASTTTSVPPQAPRSRFRRFPGL